LDLRKNIFVLEFHCYDEKTSRKLGEKFTNLLSDKGFISATIKDYQNAKGKPTNQI